MLSLTVLMVLVASVAAGPDPQLAGPLAALTSPKDFYLAENAEDSCGAVPEDLLRGNPMLMACAEQEGDADVCLCVKHERPDGLPPLPEPLRPTLNEESGFMRVCGKCVDPCALKFVPNRAPRLAMGQRVIGMVNNLVQTLFSDQPLVESQEEKKQ